MRLGEPLDDLDRQPWLESLRRAIEMWLTAGEDVILACSALKRSHRDALRVGPAVQFVYLRGSYEQIERHLKGRGHCKRDQFRASLRPSEEPGSDEIAIVVPVSGSPEDTVQEVLRKLDSGLTSP
jgi:gluconokinase